MPDCSLLRRMLEISSLSGHEGELARFLVAEMSARGFRAWVDQAGNAVGELGDGPEEVLLLGHMDTVPGDIPVRVEEGQLYGRGAVDAKGPLAAFIEGAALAGPQPGRKIVVVGAVEEEAATSKGARFLLASHRPQWVLIGEPSGWERVTLGYKGRLLVDVRVEQPLSHTAGPETGACERLVDYWLAVRDHAQRRNAGIEKRFETLDASLRSLDSGEDGLRQWADATIGLRLPPGVTPDGLQQELSALAAPGISLTYRGPEQPFRAEKSTRLVAALLASIRAAGGRPAFAYKTGTSDMNVVGPVWQCSIAAYGPGDSTLDHTPDEHVDVEEWGRGVKVVADVVRGA